MPRRVLALIALIISLVVPAAAAADVSPVASGSSTGTTTASFALTVPATANRYLAVGVSTTNAVTVSSVTYGPQVLTLQQQATESGVRSETWGLVAPNAGTATVTVTVSGAAPVIAGATVFAGVDQAAPIINGGAGQQNTGGNSASFVTNGTVTKDGMFGTMTLAPASGTTAITAQGSIDLVVADMNWSTSQGTIRGAGSSRSGNTGANLAQNAGIVWRWTNPTGGINPFALSFVALRATTGTTAPVVSLPTSSNVTTNSATLGGTMTSTGGATISQRGVVYCTCANPVIGGAGVTQVNAGASDTPGAFAVSAPGLAGGTTYTFRAFATNAAGTSYTGDAQFTTVTPNRAPTANAGGPYSFTEGSALTLAGSGTDADNDPLTYSWDVNGDGTYGDATGASPTLTTAQLDALGLDDGPGSAAVRVRVSDGSLTTTSAATTVTVNNAVPNATVGNSGPVAEGSTATVSFTGVNDPSSVDTAAGFRYGYDFDNNGTYEVGGSTYATATTSATATVPASFLADGPGTRTVRMVVFDKDGVGHQYTTAITVNNAAPTGTLANVAVDEGSTATVGLTDVADAGGDAVRYAYDLDNDGTYEIGSLTYANASSATTAQLPAALTADGPVTRTVRAAVIDKDGGFSSYTATVTVRNVVPTGTLANVTVDEGSTATVGLANVADAGGDAVRYAYDFNDDATDDTAVTYANASTATTATLPAALTADGPATHTIRVRVIDKDGGFTVRTATVTVTNVAPAATLTAPATVDEGDVADISFAGVTDASAADGAAGMKYAYDFDNDGTYDVGTLDYATASPLAAVSLPAALTADGPVSRTVKAAVIDKDGGVSTYTKTITVDNVAPTATLADVTVSESAPATLEFTAADDVSAADIAAGFSYEWDVDGDGTFTPGTASVVVPTTDGPSTHTIKGAILDRDGGRHEYTATLHVTNAAPTATITGPDAVASNGETTLTIRTADVGDDLLTAVLDWGDGTTEPITGAGEKTVTHTYTTSGAKSITLLATDSDGAKSPVARHDLTVAELPAAPAPTVTPAPAPESTPTTPASLQQAITGVRITPRCLRADDLRARIAKTQTMKVRFSLAIAGPVKFRLQRLSGKGGASKCPPAHGRPHPDGKRVPGVYSPFTNKSVTVRKGANTMTVAATGRSGKRLKPGTYLLTITSGQVTARTKLWVLANE
ncbi:PKD domain-containing protein [Solirubrobacter ginsenosidimutans]|uniref:PKD domain-containing protein n=1 Tax=Solirubrobacter ginsenosidimutans TaxID=490573 RepID=A0A9X3S363_9ACTN|nr:PKD domain-containing protein [Solirubrobacter ginsenosidimutans]MDA0161791.1 PKD domain-containing protein [Solirubrobacter ginsenosidimutans]